MCQSGNNRFISEKPLKSRPGVRGHRGHRQTTNLRTGDGETRLVLLKTETPVFGNTQDRYTDAPARTRRCAHTRTAPRERCPHTPGVQGWPASPAKTSYVLPPGTGERESLWYDQAEMTLD